MANATSRNPDLMQAIFDTFLGRPTRQNLLRCGHLGPAYAPDMCNSCYRESNYTPERRAKYAEKNERRRGRQAGLPAVRYDRLAIYCAHAGICQSCFERIDLSETGKRAFTIDHIWPIDGPVRIGDVPWNVWPMHQGCNSSKQSTLPDDHYEDMYTPPVSTFG